MTPSLGACGSILFIVGCGGDLALTWHCTCTISHSHIHYFYLMAQEYLGFLLKAPRIFTYTPPVTYYSYFFFSRSQWIPFSLPCTPFHSKFHCTNFSLLTNLICLSMSPSQTMGFHYDVVLSMDPYVNANKSPLLNPHSLFIKIKISLNHINSYNCTVIQVKDIISKLLWYK